MGDVIYYIHKTHYGDFIKVWDYLHPRVAVFNYRHWSNGYGYYLHNPYAHCTPIHMTIMYVIALTVSGNRHLGLGNSKGSSGLK